MKKLFIILLILTFLTTSIPPTYASSMATAYLCETGLKFYRQGRYSEALHEFKKALLINPSYQPALNYIRMIEQIKLPGEKKTGVVSTTFEPTIPSAIGSPQETLDLIEIQREMVKRRQLAPSEIEGVSYGLPQPAEFPYTAVTPAKKSPPSKILTLDDSFNNIPQPIKIQQDKSIIIQGKNIQRFLLTQPDVITVEKSSPDELLLAGKDIGYTYLHIWDDNGRWTTEILGIFPEPEGTTYEELARLQEERAGDFRLRYTLDWSSYEQGRRIATLERQGYSWAHGLSLTGGTPYGNFDSSASIRKVVKSTDLSSFTVGLTDGRVGPFKDFTLRGFDFYPSFSNLAFPGATLRGGMLYSPAFEQKLDYTAFWGREGGGRYGNLSPGLGKIKDSFLEGFNLDYSPTKLQDYQFTLVHGRGKDRAAYLKNYGFDLMSNWNFHKWAVGYEVAHDSENSAHLLTSRYIVPKLNLNAELRNISKKFYSITGSGWRQGQLGGLFNLNYTPFDALGMSSGLGVYQDRLFPAEDNNNRWNEDFDWSANYRVDPLTYLNFSYSLQNDLGVVSQYRNQNSGIGISRTIQFIRDISTYANYYHQENKSYSSPSSDYINNKLYLGLRFGLIGQLYYYVNKELNQLESRYADTKTYPNVLETGVDWSSQILNLPFYGSFRFTFHDEEDTISDLSFLSGEDYIEGYTEISYKPTNDNEIYGACRMRNVWADNPNVTKQIEMEFNVGMRYLWDTGVRWESIGNIEGYVFKDFNSDGLRQRDEPPVEGIKLWLGKNKSQVTDLFGYYKFKGVRARKVYVNLDTSTLPPGFVVTVPVTQEEVIANNRTVRADFGIISRSEIRGLVFEDVNGNGEYDKGDKGVGGAIITLEGGKLTKTEITGSYSFANASVGEHTMTLDLNSLPVYYLPKTALTKKITLSEGVTYIYNIPLKRVKQ